MERAWSIGYLCCDWKTIWNHNDATIGIQIVQGSGRPPKQKQRQPHLRNWIRITPSCALTKHTSFCASPGIDLLGKTFLKSRVFNFAKFTPSQVLFCSYALMELGVRLHHQHVKKVAYLEGEVLSPANQIPIEYQLPRLHWLALSLPIILRSCIAPLVILPYV